MRENLDSYPPTVRFMLTSTNLFSNYIALAPGVPTRLHFTDWYFTVRVIADRESGKTKPIKTVVFWVDELNGQPASRTYSIMSKKLMAHMIPFLPDKEYTCYDFVITQMGDGFYTDWNVQPNRRIDCSPLEERKESFDAAKLIEKLWEAI